MILNGMKFSVGVISGMTVIGPSTLSAPTETNCWLLLPTQTYAVPITCGVWNTVKFDIACGVVPCPEQSLAELSLALSPLRRDGCCVANAK